MILIFTPKYEDMIFLITHLGGFPMNGRLLSASEYEPFKAVGRNQAEDFGYIKAPCSLFNGSPDVIYSWGEDLIQSLENETVLNEKKEEQFENVTGLLTNDSLDSVYAFVIGKMTAYIPKLFSFIGTATSSVFLAEIQSLEDFKTADDITINNRTETQKIFKVLLEKESILCPVCGKSLSVSEKHFFCRSCSFSIPRIVKGRTITCDELRYILTHKKTPLISGFSGNYYGRIILKDEKLFFSKDSEYKCPSCGKSLYVRLDTNEYTCEACEFTLPKEIQGHTLTKEEIKSLLSDKKTGHIDKLSGFLFLNSENGFLPEIVSK